MYITLIENIKPHSSPWFPDACACAIDHRNPIFRLYRMGKSSDSKAKFRKASHRCKNVLEAAKLANANKTKESITSQKTANSDLNKGKSTIPPVFNGPEMLSSASDKGKLFAENFSRNCNHDESSISLPVFRSRNSFKLHNISVTHKMIKKVIMNFDLSKASGPDFIPVVALRTVSRNFLIY